MQFKLKRFKTELNITRIANMHYFEFSGDYTTKTDSHPFCELVYADSGFLRIKSENFDGILEKNEMIIHGANEIHDLSCDKNTSPNVIIIGFECDCAALSYFSKHKITLSASQKKTLAEIVKEGRNVFLPPYGIPNLSDMKKRRNFLFGADQLIKNLLEYFLIKLVREYETDGENGDDAITDGARQTNEIVDYIDRNFAEKITLDELALLFCTNRTSLCRSFRAAVGTTVIDYINAKKVNEAKRLIRTRDKTFTAISEQLNFGSVHYFNRIFKRYEKMTPTEYINSIISTFEK